ncbi:hypothetical protein ESCNG_30111 [Neisseria gonorrhoeae]|nr:hypothetical protein ESCNG_30111 [Neisseria gonorrhoeae]
MVCRLKGLAGVHFFNDAVGNVVLGVDVNHVLQNDIVTFLFGDFDDDAVGVLLEGGKLFVAAEVVVFFKLRLFFAERFDQPAPFFFGLRLFCVLKFAAGELPFQIQAFALQFLQFVLTGGKFAVQCFLNLARLLGFEVDALGVDKADFLEGVGVRACGAAQTDQGGGKRAGQTGHGKTPSDVAAKCRLKGFRRHLRD